MILVLIVLASIAIGYCVYCLSDLPVEQVLPEPKPLNLPSKTWVAKTRVVLIPIPLLILCIILTRIDSLFVAVRLAVFLTFLATVFWLDAAYYVTPDWLTVPCFLWAIGASVIAFVVGDKNMFFPLYYEAIVGACVGAGSVAIVTWLGEVLFRKEVVGFGDVIVAAVVGVHVGVTRVWLALLLAVLLGAICGVFALIVMYGVKRWEGKKVERFPPMPFSIFLAPTAVLSLFFAERIIKWVLPLAK